MGKKNIVNLYENQNQAICASIDKIVVEIFNKREYRKSQSILLTGCSPLVGTTSTCIGLSIALANTKRRTLLVDCDVRKALKYKKLSEETTLGLADYLVQEDDNSLQLDDIVYSTNIDYLSYIPCGAYTSNSTRILCSAKMEKLMEAVNDKFDFVIFDLPSLAIVPDAQILFQSADGIVLLSALGETRKQQIKEAKMKVAPYAEKYYGMIINKIQLDMYRRDVRDFDYYFVDKSGEQKLIENTAYKRYKKTAQKVGGQKNEKK